MSHNLCEGDRLYSGQQYMYLPKHALLWSPDSGLVWSVFQLSIQLYDPRALADKGPIELAKFIAIQ
jgi:hypothetical protein